MVSEIENLREELRQSIRMLEDAVITGNNEFIYMVIGKMGHIQSMIDHYEDLRKQQLNSIASASISTSQMDGVKYN